MGSLYMLVSGLIVAWVQQQRLRDLSMLASPQPHCTAKWLGGWGLLVNHACARGKGAGNPQTDFAGYGWFWTASACMHA